MAYQVLALKYRPKLFSEVRGQEEITTTLRKALAEGRIANAYLFAGPRGVGKTTTARILARSLTCVHGPTPDPCNKCEQCLEILESRSLDFIEIDGASNRGIDEIRTINENSQFLPVKNRYKIYLIDEVHMLTDYAFNALLKTLEEPPQHTKFIFATTNPNKLLPTIISRCQRYDFHLISGKEIVSHLSEVARKEQIMIEPAALTLISRSAAGSLRDAFSILDQLASFRYGEVITVSDVERLLSLVSEETYLKAMEAIFTGNRKRVLEVIDHVSSAGYDLFQFCSGILEFARYLVLIKSGAKEVIAEVITKETLQALEVLATGFSQDESVRLLEVVAEERDRLKYEDLIRVRLEAALLKLTHLFGKGEFAGKEEEKEKREFSANNAQQAPLSEEETQEKKNLSTSEMWEEFLSLVSREKPFFHPVLQSAGVKRIETGKQGYTLHLTFQRNFEKNLLERNQAELEALWKKKFKDSIHFNCSLESEEKKKTKVRSQTVTPVPKESGDRVHFSPTQKISEAKGFYPASLTPEEEGIVRRVLELFEGEVVTIGKEV